MENAIEVRQISKSYGNVVALENVDLNVRRGFSHGTPRSQRCR